MTLGMIWTIILRFAIQDIQIEGMGYPDLFDCLKLVIEIVLIVNFHTSQAY